MARNSPQPRSQNDINNFTSVVDDGGLNPRAVSLDNEEGLWQSSSAIPASASNHVIVYMSYPMQPRRSHSVQLGVKPFLALVSSMDHSSFIHVERQRVSGQVRVLFKIISCYHSRSNPKPCKTSNVQFRVVRRPASSLKVSGHREPARLDVISSEATSRKRTKVGVYSAHCS